MADSMEVHIEKLEKEFGNELYYKNISERYKNWNGNVHTVEDKAILDKLFTNLKFYSKLEIKDILSKKIKDLKAEYQDLERSSILPLTPIDGRYSGSNELIGLIKEIDVEYQHMGSRLLPYKNSILTDLNYTDGIDVLIFIDDISGTGNTLSKFIEHHQKLLEQKKVIFFFLAVTSVALERISCLKIEYPHLEIEVLYEHELKKVSELNILSSDEFHSLLKLESSLWKKDNNNIMGYAKSELLVLFSHNIPNNTLSNLWIPENKKWKRLFTRITAPPRKQQNMAVASKGGNK